MSKIYQSIATDCWSVLDAVDEGLHGRNALQSVAIAGVFWTQWTKAYMAEMPCNQLLLID